MAAWECEFYLRVLKVSLSALVDKIRIAKQPCNILYIESGVHNQGHDISRWMLHNLCSLHLIYYIILYRLTVSAVQFRFHLHSHDLLTLDSLLVFVSTKVLKCSKELTANENETGGLKQSSDIVLYNYIYIYSSLRSLVRDTFSTCR